jgi:hypothetical protein
MNENQWQAMLDMVDDGCQALTKHSPKGACGKPATLAVIWSFVDTTANESEHPVLMLVRCPEHEAEARAQKPQNIPPHIRVDIHEETFKPRPAVLSS